MHAQETGYYRDPSTVKLQVWRDLLAAMGRKVKTIRGEFCFTADDLRAIGQVWRDPESPISLRELADRLDKETGKHSSGNVETSILDVLKLSARRLRSSISGYHEAQRYSYSSPIITFDIVILDVQVFPERIFLQRQNEGYSSLPEWNS